MKKEVSFKSENLTLKGTLFTPDDKKSFGGVIFFHGSGSSRKNYLPVCEDLLEKGIASLAFDFRGCGESDGKFEESNVEDNISDGRSALKFFLRQKGIKENGIGLVGSSRGGHVASVIAGESPNIISLILRAPAAYSKDLASKPPTEYTDDTLVASNWKESEALKAIASFKNFLLIIASENDNVVPFEMIQEFKDRSGAEFSEIQTIKGADHSLSMQDGRYRKEFNDMVVTWFTRKG